MTEARKLVISVIIMAAALAGVGTWLTLGMRQAAQLETSMDQKVKELANLKDKMAAVPVMRQERQKLASELEECETILPNDREFAKILDTLSDYLKKAGVEMKQFTPVREKDDKKSTASYKRVSYELDLTGDYFSFIRFLNLLENHNRFMQVDTFTVKQKDEDSLINEITVALSTFVYDPKLKTAAAPSAKSKPAAAKKGGNAKKTVEVPFGVKKELAARFVYAASTSMRDPFTNPLTRRVALAKVDTPKVVPQKDMTPEQERDAADEVEKQLAEAEPLIGEDKLDEAAKLLGDAAFVRGQTFHDETVAQRALGLSREWQRLDTLLRTARGEKLYRVVEDIYEKMTAAFESEDYDEVFKLHNGLDTVLGRDAAEKAVKKDSRGKTTDKTAKPAEPAKEAKDANIAKDAAAPAGETAVVSDPIHERLAEVVNACDTLAKRAEVRKEFSGVAIRIQGTFWSGRGDNRKAAAIINGKMLGEGDVLKSDVKAAKTSSKAGAPAKADAEIVVKKIDRDKVVFAYKDELIERSQFKLE